MGLIHLKQKKKKKRRWKAFFFEKSNFVLIETMNGRKDYGKTRRKTKVNLSFR